MSRHTKRPLTLPELYQEGGPVRVRDVSACSSLPASTVLYDLRFGTLKGWKRSDSRNAPWLITRADARAYVARMTGHHAA